MGRKKKLIINEKSAQSDTETKESKKIDFHFINLYFFAFESSLPIQSAQQRLDGILGHQMT